MRNFASLRNLIIEGLVLISLISLILAWNITGQGQDHPIFQPSDVKIQLRTLATALESYYVDNNAYPPAMTRDGRTVIPDANGISVGYVPRILTTPIAYLTSVPMDPYTSTEYPDPFRYGAKLKEAWILTSQGPDLKPDIDLDAYLTPEDRETRHYVFTRDQNDKIYDPTNGTLSSGDIYRTGP
jgi:hypothetical protein